MSTDTCSIRYRKPFSHFNSIYPTTTRRCKYPLTLNGWYSSGSWTSSVGIIGMIYFLPTNSGRGAKWSKRLHATQTNHRVQFFTCCGHSVCWWVGAWDVRLQILVPPEKDNSFRFETTSVCQSTYKLKKTNMYVCLYVSVCMRFLLPEHQNQTTNMYVARARAQFKINTRGHWN